MPIAGVVTFLGIAAAIAAVELGLRRLAHRPPDAAPPASSRQPSMTASRAQGIYERVLYVVAPAAVAGAIVAIRLEDLPLGLFVAATVVATTTLLWPGRFPLHLMGIAQTLLRFALPILGVVIALLPLMIVGNWDVTPEAAVSAIIGTSIVVVFGLWLEAAFDADRPVRLAVIGSHSLARKLATEMRQTEIRGYVVVGHIGPEPEPQKDRSPEDVLPTLGDMSEVRTIVQLFSIDLLAVGPDAPRLEVFEETANACLDLPVRMIEASAFYEDVLGHVPIGQINSAWFQSIMHPRYSPTSPVSKRIFDLVIAVPLAIVTLILLPFLAFAVKLGGGEVFYRQRRVGEQGREFDILKLRTMRPDAAELAGRVPKDDLITPVGRILRKTHLDELPQVLNVVRGDMTIVGPRPEQPQLVKELAEVVPYYERRSLVKPGVTGWAQLRCGYAGSKTGTAWKICHDLNYVKRRSIAFDLLIVLQTFQLFFARDAEDVEMEAPAEDFILGETASLIGR
ncbi:MAG TPA: sugar transferase [Thermoleophilaceae bacterium]|nr:sugar transferase [Thermoleophilaceae bacterium]